MVQILRKKPQTGKDWRRTPGRKKGAKGINVRREDIQDKMPYLKKTRENYIFHEFDED